MKKSSLDWVAGTCLIGVLLMLLGFAYDVLFAGIPYQDPPADLLLQYERNARIAAIVFWTGGVCFLAGCCVAIVRLVFRSLRKSST